MKKRISSFILIIIFLIGLSLLLYPTFSDYWNSLHQSRAISSYVHNVADLDKERYDQMWADAENYNKQILERVNPYFISDAERQAYSECLNISSDGMMGYIEIPTINCLLPIYHGINDTVLQRAIGHIDYTSLPIGGESTHSALSGHRGLPSAKLFSTLDKLDEGDLFLIRIMDETLTYEVDQILIVEPTETSSLEIVEGEDYCTLITCTPYGVNTHRLLVRGHRVDAREISSSIRVTADAIQIEPIVVAPIIAVLLLLIMIVWFFISKHIKRKS